MKFLIVIDMQNDFLTGSLGNPETKAVIPAVAEKVKKYAEDPEGFIVYTRDTHYQGYLDTQEGKKLPIPHCIYKTEGWEIEKTVYNEKSVIIDKFTFGKSTIGELIREWGYKTIGKKGVDSIELVGVCTDICVISNALILKSEFTEVPIFVDAKCCAGVTPEKHEAALEVMRSCQIDII